MTATIARTEHQITNDLITEARQSALPDAAKVATYRAYVLGDQPVTLPDSMKADLGTVLTNGYTDNLCRLAVTTAADYLSLARIDLDADDGPARDALEAFIEAAWQYNQVPELEAKANVAVYRDGNHAVGLGWSARTGRVRLFNLPWWNGTSGVFVHYDETNLPDWAVSEKTERGDQGETIMRRTVWYPDRIERYVSYSGAGGWEPYRLPGDTSWPMPWMGKAFDPRTGRVEWQPVGIPVVHFPCFLVPNDQAGAGSVEGDSRYGLSLLAGGALGVQDALNDAHYDLIVAARRSAFPVYTATGVALQRDPADPTRFVPLQTGPGSLLQTPDKDGRFGILLPGDMGQLFTVVSGHTRVFARLTNTPMQIVNEEGTDAQSGVALLRMQLAAVRQARRTQTVSGSRWGAVFHKAAQIARAFGGGAFADLDPDIPLVGAYDPIEASDVAVLAEVGKLLTEAGLPLSEVLRMLGKSPADIDRIMQAKRDEAQAAAPVVAPTPDMTGGDQQQGQQQAAGLAANAG